MRRRVVITGLGAVAPLGGDIDSIWQAATAGQSGVARITNFAADTFPVQIAAEVKDWSIESVGLKADDYAHHARQTRFAIAAALQAADAAGLAEVRMDPVRLGVFLGCGEIFPELDQLAGAIAAQQAVNDPAGFLDRYRLLAPATSELTMDPGVAVSEIAGLVGAEGPSVNITNACVSSAAAIGEAMEAIRRGDADLMLAGGGHSMVNPTGITGLCRLQTLSRRNDAPQQASRPFDRERDGFVAGEGAAVLMLEELEHARRRGAEIWGELIGYGAAHDAYRVTDLRPDAHSAVQSMRLALKNAGLDPSQIDYINAHGSSTAVNDSVETAAIKQAFGEHAQRVAISSTKSMTGHLTTACGALEVLFCTLSTRHGVAPPTINYEHPDPECDLDYTPNEARQLDCRYAMNNNFGFGGQNVAIVVARFDD